jgi:hypothetical protein
MSNELNLSYGTLVVVWLCIEKAYTRASTLLSWVALWALGFVRASVRARTGGCGSGSSLTAVFRSRRTHRETGR